MCYTCVQVCVSMSPSLWVVVVTTMLIVVDQSCSSTPITGNDQTKALDRRSDAGIQRRSVTGTACTAA